MNKRIVFLIIICMALLLAGCGSVQKDVAGSDSSIGVSYVRQLVAEDNGTSRAIMWQSQELIRVLLKKLVTERVQC